MLSQLLPAIRTNLVLALLIGLAFPCAITAVSQVCFPHQSNGSLVVRNDKIVGSSLLGQAFSKPEFFHSRPSAAGSGYAGEASSGTNFGPTSKKLILGDESFQGVKQQAEVYRKENNLLPDAKVPVDAVTRSSSGLDPGITPANALLQVARVAKARNLEESKVRDLVKKYTRDRDLGILGEPTVNVLALNLELESLTAPDH